MTLMMPGCAKPGQLCPDIVSVKLVSSQIAEPLPASLASLAMLSCICRYQHAGVSFKISCLLACRASCLVMLGQVIHVLRLCLSDLKLPSIFLQASPVPSDINTQASASRSTAFIAWRS